MRNMKLHEALFSLRYPDTNMKMHLHNTNVIFQRNEQTKERKNSRKPYQYNPIHKKHNGLARFKQKNKDNEHKKNRPPQKNYKFFLHKTLHETFKTNMLQ